MGFSLSCEVQGADVLVRGLDRLGRRLSDLSEPMTEAGFLLATRIWDRITAKPLNYSAKYNAWLVAHGEYDGKLVGILSGALLGATAPAAGPGGASLDVEVSPSEALVGFLDPGQEAKARGFVRWFLEKYGEEAVRADPADEQNITAIFDRWLAREQLAAGLEGG